MDFGGPDPRFGTFGKVLDCGPLEVTRGIRMPTNGERSTGGDDADQRGEEWRIGTCGGANIGTKTN